MKSTASVTRRDFLVGAGGPALLDLHLSRGLFCTMEFKRSRSRESSRCPVISVMGLMGGDRGMAAAGIADLQSVVPGHFAAAWSKFGRALRACLWVGCCVERAL